MEAKIPEFNQFVKEVENIYPEGNLPLAYQRLKWCIANDSSLKIADPWGLIKEQFKRHVETWKKKYGERDEKYIGKDERTELKDITTFIGQKMWEHSFGGLQMAKHRDKYLFPLDISKDELTKRRKEFEARFKS